ncbi:MAG: TolC family protein, partial [Acetobacteraceae bacterium]
MIRRLFRSALPLALVLGACDLGPEYQRPEVEMPVQFRATEATGAAAWPSDDWWRGFDSAELNALIEQARAQNFDIAAAIARVIQADAQVRIAGAPMLPTTNVTGNASWQHSGISSSGSRGSTTGTTFVSRSGGSRTIDTHFYDVGLNVAYEVDFWDHNLAGFQSAEASAVFSRFDQQVVALTVVTNVANTWFTALA